MRANRQSCLGIDYRYFVRLYSWCYLLIGLDIDNRLLAADPLHPKTKRILFLLFKRYRRIVLNNDLYLIILSIKFLHLAG